MGPLSLHDERIRGTAAPGLPVHAGEERMSGVMLITGGGRGIGAATATLAARRGYAVCVNYRSDEASAGKVVEAIVREGGRAHAVRGDVSREADVIAMF